MTHALNYGTGALVACGPIERRRTVTIFRPLDHFQRVLNSGKLLLMDLPHTPETMLDVLLELLRTENYRGVDVYIRPLIYKSSTVIGVRLHDLEADFTMFAQPFGSYIHNEEGSRVTFSAWRRIDDNMIPARGKITGAYANSAFIKTDATLSGFDEALVLDHNGHISEGSAENSFMVRDGVAITPPVTTNILRITRRTIMHLLSEEMGMPVEVREIDRTEVFIADEAFFCGRAQVVAITEVDHRSVERASWGRSCASFASYTSTSCAARSPSTAPGTSQYSAHRHNRLRSATRPSTSTMLALCTIISLLKQVMLGAATSR